MTVGYIMLCHTALHRAAQVATHWAESGSPVVIHLDARVRGAQAGRLRSDLAAQKKILFSPRHACEWGMWGMVAATLDAARLLLERFPEVRHICLVSGACLPLRPPQEFAAWLAGQPDTDFIESVTTADVSWTMGGLDAERFTLRFPFSWRRHRRLFDGYVRLQRRLRMRRHIPEGMVPHLGSQWWCLTRETLSAILNDPRRAEFDRYFSRVWIPDESYFQSLVRLHARRVESRSLTLSKFDHQGKPHVFYDDHLQLLRRSDCFIARKIWPQANRLYREFLKPEAETAPRAEPNPGKIDRLFSRAAERRLRGRPGLYMQSRFPAPGREGALTAQPYTVFVGYDDVFEGFESWLSKSLGARVHGHLFAAERVEFARGATIWNGCLTDSASLRDYDPQMFLTSLIWNSRGERQTFQFGPRDSQDILPFLARDPHARISMISGAWAVRLFRQGGSFEDQRREAARLQKIETAMIDRLRAAQMPGRIDIRPLAEFLEDPFEPLEALLGELRPGPLRAMTEPPRLGDMAGFGRFVQNLRNQGMKPVLLGDIPLDEPVVPGRRAARNRLTGENGS